jgi:hypothetical protein
MDGDGYEWKTEWDERTDEWGSQFQFQLELNQFQVLSERVKLELKASPNC